MDSVPLIQGATAPLFIGAYMTRLILLLPLLFVFFSVQAEAKLVRKRTPDCFANGSGVCATDADFPKKSGNYCYAYEFEFYDNGWTRGGFRIDTLCDGGQAPIKNRMFNRPGICVAPSRYGVDAEGKYCEKEEEDKCKEKKDKSYSFTDQKVGRQAVERKSGCESGCEATLSGLSCVNMVLNGSFTGALCSGSATYTGASCEQTDPPPEGEPKEPQSPSDCQPGFRLVNVSGKNKCVYGDGGDKKTEFCKDPANQYSQTCSEGGEENCKANPGTQACTPGTDRYCAVSPKRHADPACVFGSADWCKQHPTEKACTPGADEYCALNPLNPQCQEAQAAKCKAAPDTPECKKAEQCALNPNDPACKAGDDYCKKFPNDDKCKKSEFGGSCGANGAQGTFNCTGDAIQCAIAKEQHRRSCQLFDGTATAYEALKTESAGAMAGEGGALKGRHSEVSMAGKFDGVRAAAGGNVGTCNITDRDIAIPGVSAWSGGSVRIPLSIICEYGDAIRAIFLFMSAMSCTWLYYQFLIRR